MRYAVTNGQMKEAEKICSERYISYSGLMMNAGSAAAERIMELVPESAAVTVICGGGNNGGDGFVIARILSDHGRNVKVVTLSPPKTECAKEHFSRLFGISVIEYEKDKKLALKTICSGKAAVDCVYGTGFHGIMPERVSEAIRAANSCEIRIAIDVPSGINSDTGETDRGYFKATNTLVLAAMKKGMLSLPCADCLGKIELLDIGIDESCYTRGHTAVIADEGLRRPFPEKPESANKGDFGRMLNIAGSLRYSGAAALSTMAALRSGVGLCTLAAPISAVRILAGGIHEATYLPLPEDKYGFASEGSIEAIEKILPKMNAVSVGCGMGNNENTKEITEFVIRNAECPVIIDADGINCVSGNIDILKERERETIITPHPLEFSRITGKTVSEINGNRIDLAKEFAKEYGVTVVLKGRNTVTAFPDGEACVNMTGNNSLARGGSGDTLTGIIAAMAAQGVPADKAAASGVYCHALASDILIKRMPRESILAGDIISVLSEVYKV